ncbi:RHS repeat-associated core domain-containing protein [Pseudomonas viridiflava]
MQLTTLQPKRKNFFFQGDQLVCQASDSTRHLLWANGIALAELDTKRTTSKILQSDNANTALRGIPGSTQQNYSPYGFLHTAPSAHLVAFSGQRLDRMLDCYALGNGHRFYSPRSGRFLQPDTQSPFRKGGPNGYCYCQNDPINRNDPSGQWWEWLKRGVNWLTGQLPTLSVDRPQLRIGGSNWQSSSLRINLHRTGQTPAPDSPHISLHIDDLEFAATIGNNIINSPEVLEPLSTTVVNRVENFAAGVTAAYVTHHATNSIGLALAAQISTQLYLERGAFEASISTIRGRPPEDLFHMINRN